MSASSRQQRNLLLLLGAATATALVVAAGFWLRGFSKPEAPSAGIAIGTTAPSIAKPATTGQSLTLDQLRGSKVVLYFYEAAG